MTAALWSINCLVQEDMDKLAAAKNYQADVVFVGSDWKGTQSWKRYEEELAQIGCKVVYLEHTNGISSSMLRERINQI